MTFCTTQTDLWATPLASVVMAKPEPKGLSIGKVERLSYLNGKLSRC
jgi:hypothetical protein